MPQNRSMYLGLGELAVGVAMEGQEADRGEQPNHAEVNGWCHQPGDPRGDAEIEAEPGHVAEGESETHDDDRGGYL